MTAPVWIVYNPYAARWNAGKRKAAALAALDRAGLNYQLHETSRRGHAQELAAQARQAGAPAVVAAGGDGTISEIVNGLFQDEAAAPRPRLGILPLGSANDLCVNLSLPLDLDAAAAIIAAGKSRCLDLGLVRFEQDGQTRTRLFDNNSAIGLEPTVSLIQEKIGWLHGPPRYLLAALAAILRNPHWQMRLEWQGGSYAGPITMVTVGNNPLTGGLFYLTPRARPDDGLLSFVYGSLAGRLDKFRILPRTMRNGPGNYTEHPAVHQADSPWLKITCDHPSPLHTDGEVQTAQTQQIEYRALPAAIEVFCP